VLLEVLYGTGSQHPVAYLFCAFAGIAGLLQREHPSGPKRVTAVWILLWVLIALAAVFGGFRTAAYWGLASMYTAAAINLQNRLTAGIGRFVIVFSLGIFTATFAFHSLVLLHPFLRPIHDEIWSLQKYFLSVGLLMTLLEQELKTNQWLVAHDTLTGLPNRRQMDACLLHAIATGNAGVLLLDLEDFKKINDSMGREAGNEILQRIAGVLGQITETDETLTRFSGGSFAIVSSRSLAHLPRVLQALIAEPMAVHAHQVQLGTSIGTAFFPADANGYEGAQAAAELVRVADRRMNRNKGGGKGDFLGRWPGLSQIH